ncbi:MAG: peptidoglycan DL-endopeptidase CwlO [Frankiaceae bacterium]|nr:peptidoglycan DL-endopeptidase CwlO [Frankiaceae bacterium]
MLVPRRLVAVCVTVTLTASVPAAAWAGNRHDKLRHAQQHAARLDAKARQQAAQIAASRRTLVRLDAQANAALAALQRATLDADRARQASDEAQAQLSAARANTDAARALVADTAAGAYRTMASGGQIAATLSLVQSGDPQAFLSGLQVLGQVGKRQGAVVDDLRVAEAQQLRSEHLAAAATARAVATERGATIARQHADTLVAEQQHEVARERQLLAQTRTAASNAHALAHKLQQQIAAARARAEAIRLAQARRVANGGPVATCNGGSVSGYANGQLPVSALCPLWDAPGMMLRSDAAAAFNRMSQAYAAAFGTPMCVTSSYRTYQHQVELYATMPAGYAAVPGTSNHGWGLAVDLCGGVQVDNSPEHLWLLDNAASYSWFHPSWALPGGPGPHEPWHWEYAG